MKVGEMEENPKSEKIKEENEPRNSFAPNDGFYPSEKWSLEQQTNESDEFHVTKDVFKERITSILKKRINPKPNATDKIMYPIYRRFSFYFPFVAFMSCLDFFSDWMNTVSLVTSTTFCYEKVFGYMMAITIIFLPWIYAYTHPNLDEQRFHERWLRKFCFQRGTLNPYLPYSPGMGDETVRKWVFWIYVLFSPATHVVSQVKVHHVNVAKVSYYNEFNYRSQALFNEIEKGKFQEFDKDDLQKLNVLQRRAVQYVAYYIKYAKSRFKFCLIEDAIQFNVQFCLAVATAFSPLRSDISGSLNLKFDYSSLGSLSPYYWLEATPSTIRLGETLLRLVGVLMSGISLWVGLYMSEKTHEVLITGKPVSLGRLLALMGKTVIELVLPAVSLITFAMQSNSFLPQGPSCDIDGKSGELVILKAILCYLIFPLGYTYTVHLFSALILNLSNRRKRSKMDIFKETWSFAVFNACLCVKYNRIGKPDDTHETKWAVGPYQFFLLVTTSALKFVLPVLLINFGMSDYVDLTPRRNASLHMAVSSDMSFKYAMQHPIPILGDPVVDILDFTNEYTVMPLTERGYTIDPLVTEFIKNFFDDNYVPGADNATLHHQLTNSKKYACQEIQETDRSHRICFWHRNVQWAENSEEIMKSETIERLKENGEPFFWSPTGDSKFPFMQPNLLIYSRISDDIEGVDSFDHLTASDFNPENPSDRLLYQKRNDAYQSMQKVYQQVCAHVRPIVRKIQSDDPDSKLRDPCETMYHVSLLRQIHEISLPQEAQEKQDDPRTKIPNRMVKWYSLLSRNLPPSSQDEPDVLGHIKMKINYWLLFLYIAFVAFYVLAEIDLPGYSKWIRYEFLTRFYPLGFPVFILLLNGSLALEQIKQQNEVYCLINPDSDKIYFENTFMQLDANCHRAQRDISYTDKIDDMQKVPNPSMAKCGLGMECYTCVPSDTENCDDFVDPNGQPLDNWAALNLPLTETCIEAFKKDYNMPDMDTVVNTYAYGDLAQLYTANQNTQIRCLFNYETIKKLPYGPDVHPSRCPKVARRLVKGAITDKDFHKFKFDYYAPHTDIQAFENSYKKVDLFLNVPQARKRGMVKNWPLYKLAFKDYARETNEIESGGLTCLKNSAKRRLDNVIKLGEDADRYEDGFDSLQKYLDWDVLTYRINKAERQDSSITSDLTQESIDTSSIYLLMNEQENFVHRIHQPKIDNKTTEFFYMSFQENINIEEYTMETIAASDCTPDDIYSWDAPFDSSETIQCNGTAKPINDFFGGKPGDRNYDLVDGEKSTTHYGFNGCPAVINNKMHIFGVGPDMKDYMREMYNEYYNTWNLNRDRKYKIDENDEDTGCVSRIAQQLAHYADKFWKGEKNFRYLIPKESYGHNSLAMPRGKCDVHEDCVKRMHGTDPNLEANAPITGFLDCQIRHDANSYGRHYWGPNNYWALQSWNNPSDKKYKWAKYFTRGDLIRGCGIHSQGFFPDWRPQSFKGSPSMGSYGMEPEFTDNQFGSAFFNNSGQWIFMRTEDDAHKRIRYNHKLWYVGPEPARFFFFDFNGQDLAKLSGSTTYADAYSAKGFTHPELDGFFSKLSLVLPVHGLMMHKNKKSKNLDVTAEHAATGQLVQALLMNEGYNQIFSYLFTQKNCEKRDITRWTNLHLATVSENFENIAVENIRNKLAGTSYSSSMRLAPDSSPTKIGESIGSYAGKTFSMTSRYDEAVTSWSETNTSSPSNASLYDEDAEYSLYRWTYFFDYEESDYSAGPEEKPTKDSRFNDEETRLANAILWLRDYDNSQKRRRNLLESTYLINRFSYPDANQDGQKFINAETHNFHAYQTKSPVAFSENPLSFTTPLRSERTDAANEVSGFHNDIMYTPQRWGVYPFKGISKEYEQPVMDEYALSPLGFDKKRRTMSLGHYKLEEYRDDQGYYLGESDPILPNGDLNLTAFQFFGNEQHYSHVQPQAKLIQADTHTWNWTASRCGRGDEPDSAFGINPTIDEQWFRLSHYSHVLTALTIKCQNTGNILDLDNDMKDSQLFTHFGATPAGFGDLEQTKWFKPSMQWYWSDEKNQPTTGYSVKSLSRKQLEKMKTISGLSGNPRNQFMYKPHCFLASDHDIGGFFEPFKRNPSDASDFQGTLNQADYLKKNIWGSDDGEFSNHTYFRDSSTEEGPLTMMIGKELFDSTKQAYYLQRSWNGVDHPSVDLSLSPAKGNHKRIFNDPAPLNFTSWSPFRYGTMYDMYSTEVPWLDAAPTKMTMDKMTPYRFIDNEGWGRVQEYAWTNQSQPYLEAQDAWFRQCNFLSSLDLLNFNLLDQQLSKRDEFIVEKADGPFDNEHKKFNSSQFEENFSEDHDGFLDQMLVLNKPCPVFEDKVYLFGRIRKSQEIRSRNTEEFNWNHLRQAGLSHTLGGKVMPLRLSSDKWLTNATSDDQVLIKYGNYLNTEYGIPVFDDDAHADLHVELVSPNNDWSLTVDNDDKKLVSGKDPYTDDHFKHFTHREVMNTLPTVWGMNITKGNEMYVPPLYGSNYGLSMFNDVEKTYPHPYTVTFTYSQTGEYAYRGMVPNSLSPQWGACVTYKVDGADRLICLGGMICYHHSRKNAAFSNSRARTGAYHDDSLLCDNLDDAPHNTAISPTGSNYEWETSITSSNLKKFALPIGLLGHSAVVIKSASGTEQIHVFGGMWGKLSNFKGYGFYKQKQVNAEQTHADRRYDLLERNKYMQTWGNKYASREAGKRRVGSHLKPNYVWSPSQTSYALTHEAVGQLSLVFDGAQWTRGQRMKSRRFGHATQVYRGNIMHIMGHRAGSPGIEAWKVPEDTTATRRRREAEWSEGIPYNPKPFLYDGWSNPNFDHDPTLQNYFFRTGKDYSSSGAEVFVDQFDGSSLDQSGLNNQTISLDTFFSGDYGNPYRNDSRPFFENPREAKMNKLKYAPCKFCVLYKSDGSKVDFTKTQSSTTVIQSLANDKIYKWRASVPPREGTEWDSSKRTFNYMKFDINLMDAAATQLEQNEKFDYSYFDGFTNDEYNVLSYTYST